MARYGHSPVIDVKVSTNFPHWPLARQTPLSSGQWGSCRFLVNQEVEECDFWVVLDGLTQPETTCCDRSNTLLVTCEPPDVKAYSSDFLAQFAVVLSSHRDLDHPRVLFRQQGLPWMFGAQLQSNSLKWTNFMSFEEIENYSTKKHRLLSIVASKHKNAPGHVARNRFIKELKRSLGDRVDVFGLGYEPIADKLDAIGPYRYHIAVENSCIPDYWTEKLSDAFLGRAFPIYSGCPNLDSYFPAGSYERMDISDPATATEFVAKIIASSIDFDRRSELEAARRKVLYEYNIFAVLDSLIHGLRRTPQKRPGPLTLRPGLEPEHRKLAKLGAARGLLARYARLWRN